MKKFTHNIMIAVLALGYLAFGLPSIGHAMPMMDHGQGMHGDCAVASGCEAAPVAAQDCVQHCIDVAGMVSEVAIPIAVAAAVFIVFALAAVWVLERCVPRLIYNSQWQRPLYLFNTIWLLE